MSDLPRLHRDVVFGKAGGRVIWQPRIGCWHDDKLFAGEPFPAPYTGMDLYGIYRSLGCSARLYEFNSCFRRIEDPAVEMTSREISAMETRVTIHTPVGTQTAVHRKSGNSPHAITVKWEVETPEELKVATWREENATWTWDQEQYDGWMTRAGDLGAPTMFMPRMNVQCLYIEKMGVENGVYALLTRPDEVETFFRALSECHDRLIDVIQESPVEIVNFGENIHASTLSPDLFRKYHLPECRHRCDRLHEAGKFVSSHWDGDVGPLLTFARETGLDGIEAVTPKPQGDVKLLQVREAFGEELFLLDGIPAVYFDDCFPVETLIGCAEELIRLFAPRLVLGISDEISSTGDIERIRAVGAVVDEYNARFV